MPEKFAIYCHFRTLRAPSPVPVFKTDIPCTWVQKTKNLKNPKNAQKTLKMFSSKIVWQKNADLGIFSSPGEKWPIFLTKFRKGQKITIFEEKKYKMV